MLLVFLLVSSAFLVGMATGPRFCGPFLIALLAVGLPAILFSRGWAIGLDGHYFWLQLGLVRY